MPCSPFLHILRVRYGECDPQGIVFNAHYLAYFDIALTELWRAALPGGYRQMQEAGIDMVVAEATCRYRSPARFDDELAIGLTIARLGTTSMLTAMEVDRDGERVAEGEMRHVFVELPGHAKTGIPAWVREALAPWTSVRAAVAP